MLNTIKLKHILLLGFFVRLIAVVFSKGFGWTDDQYEVIEVAHSWVRGWNYWLRDGTPSVHSVVYPGFNYLILRVCEQIGLTDGQEKMYVVRLVHALFSLLTVWYGYKITEKISNTETAKKVGLLLACLWLFPFLSVRNLIEWFCVPFCMTSFWIMLKGDQETKFNIKYALWFFAGFWIGTAFGIRIMSLIFGGGVGLALLYRKEIKIALIYGAGILLGMFALQGIVDWAVWGSPLASTKAFIEYNATQHGNYPQNHPFFFLLVLFGILIPPISLFLTFGFFRTWKQHLLLFMPALCFLLFHSLFPNRQERFIFPMLPLFIILGMIGWEDYRKNSSFWSKRTKLYTNLWRGWAVINAVLLLVLSVHYGKKVRCEPWTIIARQGDVRDVFLNVDHNNTHYETQFYLNNVKNIMQPVIHLSDSDETIRRMDSTFHPNYIVFLGSVKVGERIKRMNRIYPNMILLDTVEQGLIDRIVYFLNPKNNSKFVVYIYKTGT